MTKTTAFPGIPPSVLEPDYSLIQYFDIETPVGITTRLTLDSAILDFDLQVEIEASTPFNFWREFAALIGVYERLSGGVPRYWARSETKVTGGDDGVFSNIESLVFARHEEQDSEYEKALALIPLPPLGHKEAMDTIYGALRRWLTTRRERSSCRPITNVFHKLKCRMDGNLIIFYPQPYRKPDDEEEDDD